MKHHPVHYLLVSSLTASICGPVAAQTVKLGKRYIDAAHGFSLRPPLDTVRTRGFSTARLVSWSKREKKTDAIVWTLSVRQVIPKDKDVNLKEYASRLEADFKKGKRFKVESIKIAPLAGKGAIDLAGIIGRPIHLWQRQVWVLAEPGRFLVFAMSGPEDTKKGLHEICDEILATVELTDPKAALAERRENLERGKKLLASLNDMGLAKVVNKAPQWFLLTHKGEDVGFMHVAEAWQRVERSQGLKVRTCVLLQMPKDSRRVLRRSMFSTTRGNFERWQERLDVTSGAKTVSTVEEGLKKDELILCAIGTAHTRKKPLPKEVKPIYLPRAIGWCIFRLVDLTKQAKYAFAAYAGRENNFDMRTFTVLAPEKIKTVTGEVTAIRATDQAAADAEPATLWLSTTGKLLRMKSADGLLMDISTRPAILRRFPDAQAVISARMGQPKPLAAPPTPGKKTSGGPR